LNPMSDGKNIFDLKVTNLPLINVRHAFTRDFNMIQSDEFAAQIQAWSSNRAPIHAVYLIWGERPESLLTYLVQQAIMGVECYIQGAAFLVLGYSGKMTKEVAQKLRDPFKLGGRTAAKTFFNSVPSLIDQRHSLSQSNPSLWGQVHVFYDQIRNPLFHGSQLNCEFGAEQGFLQRIQKTYKFLEEVYQWIDSWAGPVEDLFAWPPKLNRIRVPTFEGVPGE